MSRFHDDGDWSYGRYMLWETAQGRALSSARGQQALADMEAALLALPAKRLIDSALAKDGEVCAVGAYVLHQRKAEPREQVLAELEARGDHDGGAEETASAGKEAGMAFSMAWRMAELNDEDLRYDTPEERYQHVLAWVRKAQGKAVHA